MSTITRTLPEGFAELEPYVHDWAKPTRAERYATRLSKPFEMVKARTPWRRVMSDATGSFTAVTIDARRAT